MKHSKRAPASKPPTEPNFTKATVYACAEIGMCVLIHLLDDHPKHIRYREKQKARASGLPEKSAEPESRHPHASSLPPRTQRDYQPREQRREERPRYEAPSPRNQRDYQPRTPTREEYQPRYEVPLPLPRRTAQPYLHRPSYTEQPARLFTRPSPTSRSRPPTPPLSRRPSYSELPPRLFTRPSPTYHARPPTPPLPRHRSTLPRPPGAPSPSRQTQYREPSRHQAWTRIRSVTPSKSPAPFFFPRPAY